MNAVLLGQPLHLVFRKEVEGPQTREQNTHPPSENCQAKQSWSAGFAHPALVSQSNLHPEPRVLLTAFSACGRSRSSLLGFRDAEPARSGFSLFYDRHRC